jgi:hypothetical protein
MEYRTKAHPAACNGRSGMRVREGKSREEALQGLKPRIHIDPVRHE